MNESNDYSVSSNERPPHLQHYFDEREELREKAKFAKKNLDVWRIVFGVSFFFAFAIIVPIILTIYAYYKVRVLSKELFALREQIKQLGDDYKDEYRKTARNSSNDFGHPDPSNSSYSNYKRDDEDEWNDGDDDGDGFDDGDFGGWDDGGFDGDSGGGFDGGGDGGGFDGGGDGGGGDGGGGGGDGGGDGGD